MRFLWAFTLDYVKRNRRSSLAIMVAVLMVTTMLSALCSFFYNQYMDNLRLVELENGSWHGELFEESYGSQLPIIEGFASVERTLLKGPWQVAQIDDPRRAYLIYRDADLNYWDYMPEGTAEIMLAGRIPTAPGEIALSKQYFEHHPQLQLGDTLTLPLGQRLDATGNVLNPVDNQQEGETFRQTGEVVLTVVGKLDVATSSVVPGYTALGYLDRAAVQPEDDLTIYLRFHQVRDTYQQLPLIAEALGYQVDEYGKYNLRYNNAYLTRLLVFSPEQKAALPLLARSQMPLTLAVIGLLTVAVFVLVIHNAFALSANRRLQQLGILASIGATPRQLKWSVLMEATLLSLLPLPVGIGLGHLAVKVLLDFINQQMTVGGSTEPVYFVVGWLSVLPAVLLTLLTVWWSALIPARRIARLSPIAAIRQGEVLQLKKMKQHRLSKRFFGLEGELAATAVRARKSSYRTATVSLVLSFMTLVTLLCINSASTASQAVYHSNDAIWADQDIMVDLYSVLSAEDRAVTAALNQLPGVTKSLWYQELVAATWLPAERLSSAFLAAGGYEAAGRALGTQTPLYREGQYRLKTSLLGLDRASFVAYCAQLGLEPEPFYQSEQPQVILYNRLEEVMTSSKREPVWIPYLELAAGEQLTFTEKAWDDWDGDYTFTATVAAVTEQLPGQNLSTTGRYGLKVILPLEQLIAIGQHFVDGGNTELQGQLSVQEESQISAVRQQAETVCESWFGSGDYSLLDQEEYRASEESGAQLVNLMFGFVVSLLAVIGLSNAWSTVRGNLAARQQEFAMLRSVGISPRGIRRMLAIEALLLGLSPIMLCLPFVVILQAVFLSINEVTVAEWLPYAPWLPLLLYTTVVLLITGGAYLVGGKQLQQGNVVEILKQNN